MIFGILLLIAAVIGFIGYSQTRNTYYVLSYLDLLFAIVLVIGGIYYIVKSGT